MQANLWVKMDLTSDDREKIESAIDVMDSIVKEISKCYGRYDGVLNDAKDELQKILEGELI